MSGRTLASADLRPSGSPHAQRKTIFEKKISGCGTGLVELSEYVASIQHRRSAEAVRDRKHFDCSLRNTRIE